MLKFVLFLSQLIIINVILFGLITLVCIKLRLIFQSSSLKEEQEKDRKSILLYDLMFPVTGQSQPFIFDEFDENEEGTNRQLIKTDKKLAPGLLCQEYSFVTTIEDFIGRRDFDIYVEDFAEKYGIKIEKSSDLKGLISDISEYKKHVA